MILSSRFATEMDPETGRKLVRITDGDAICYPLYYFVPSITDDLKYLVYHRCANNQVQIHAVELDTGIDRQITDASNPPEEAQWKPWCTPCGSGVLDHRSVINPVRNFLVYFDNNVAVANFPLATSERGYTLANGTVIPERTEWHNIVVRRDLVQFVEKWVRKGSGLYVEGKIRTRTYDDAQGIKRYVTEIYADRVEFYSTGSRPADSTQQSQQQPAATTYAQPAKPAAPAASEPDEPDDLPF